MANEITLNLRFRVEKTYLVDDFNPGTLLVTMTGDNATGGAVNLTTSASALSIGSISTCGYAYFRNVGTVADIEIGMGTGGSFVVFAKLKAGESCILRLGTNAPTARAVAISTTLLYQIFED
jgi:hypothetical protein